MRQVVTALGDTVAEVAEEDVYLIAAAPELLEAGKSLLAALVALALQIDLPTPAARDAAKRLAAAIAKAEGK